MSDKKHGPDNDTPGGDTVLERAPKTKKPQLYRVLLHNDDYTTMEFVVWVLQKVFRKSEAASTHLMLTIHKKGLAVVGVYTRDLAETRVGQVTKFAEQHKMPLMCTSEPDE